MFAQGERPSRGARNRAGRSAAIGLFLLPAIVSTAAGARPIYPADVWAERPAAAAALDDSELAAAREYALSGGGSGMVIHRGYAVMRWGNQRALYDLKSTTKSIGTTA